MRKFNIDFSEIFWSCEIHIDPQFKCMYGDKECTTADLIKDMVEFWTDWEDRVDTANGDYIKAFALQLARECFYIAYANNYNTYGVTQEFEDKEGYCTMDGSKGIWIISTDAAEISDDMFTVTEEV